MTVANAFGLYTPLPTLGVSGAVLYDSYLVDASGEKAAAIVVAPKSGSIRKVHFRTGTVTTPQDVDVRLETIDATTGNPSGTLFGTTTNGTVASASLASDSWFSATLTADATVTKGSSKFAVVLAPAGAPNLRFSRVFVYGSPGPRFIYGASYTTSWAKDTIYVPCVALEYSDGSFALIPGSAPYSAINTHSVSNASTPDEVALRVLFSAPVRVSGYWVQVDLDGGADVVLYDGTTALATDSVDKDIRSGTTAGIHFGLFSSSQQLSASTAYRLALKPTSATALTAYSFDVNSAAILDQLEGGQAFYWSQRTDGGAWSDTTTRRLIAGLIIDGIDDGAGGAGGGLLAHPGMRGGFA